MNNYRIADDCKMLRDIRDISQRELADELGVEILRRIRAQATKRK